MFRNIYLLSVMLIMFFIISCGSDHTANLGSLVENENDLKEAIAEAKPGSTITMSNGIWKNLEIVLKGQGTEDLPIKLKAETPGKVIITGKSNLKIGGSYLEVHGLHFKDGYTPSRSVIDFRINENTLAHNCRLVECVIEDFNQLQRDKQDLWVTLYGRHNQVDHCYFSGKSNRGPTLRVSIAGNESINNYHHIVNNHFGPRPRKGGPSAETIQIGNSHTSMSPSYTYIADNFFERCNGEVEVISSKTNFNEFRNNVFYKCEGSIVTRHGNYCIIDGNYFIGDETSNVGGVRIINTGHRVSNNYFYNLRGTGFLSPLAVMNGIPKSPLNRYNQVTDVVVAYNTWVNCTEPWHFGIGSNIDQKDVLPLSEIRSARPKRTIVANNVVYSNDNKEPIVGHDKLDGISFQKNLFHSDKLTLADTASFIPQKFDLDSLNDFMRVPDISAIDIEGYRGFEFDKIDKDILGNNRVEDSSIGCFTSTPSVVPDIMNPDKYGPSWFSTEPAAIQNKKLIAESPDLTLIIKEAKAGDTIELLSTVDYRMRSSLQIDKPIIIRANSTTKLASITYLGEEDTPLFQMLPKGELFLQNINLQSNSKTMAIASLQENMSSLYNVDVSNCIFSEFKYVFKAYKGSFADHINFTNAHFKNCKNGIELSGETRDKGDYNAEFLTFKNCSFTNIDQNVIDYYRGGYDESTIGGNLEISNCSFTSSGGSEANGILLNTHGIVNVDISDNIFNNNEVNNIAVLWGAKNNNEFGNTISNSGKIRVVENLKQKLMY